MTDVATMTISTWGNSEAIRIPKALLRQAGLRSGDRVTLGLNERGNLELERVDDGHRLVSPAGGVTFDELFRDYEGDRSQSCDAWPDEGLEGAEWDAWSR